MVGFLPIALPAESVPERAEEFRGRLADQPDPGYHLSIVHPRGPDHADRASHPLVHLVGGQHQAALTQPAARVLTADDDLDVLVEGDLLQDAGQLGALLEQLQQFFEPADLDELRMAEQVAHPVMQNDRLTLRLVSADRLDHPFEDLSLLIAIGTELAQSRQELVGSLPLDLSVEHGGHPAQVLLGDGALQTNHRLLDEVALQHQDDQDGLRFQGDQVDVFDARLTGLGRGDQRNVLGNLRQHHRRLLQDPLDAVRRRFEGLLDGPPDGRRGGLRIHQEIDEVAVAPDGPGTYRRGVWRPQVASAHEAGQFIADGGRGERDEVLGRQHLRADRDPGHGVVGDHGFQDLLLVVVEGSSFRHGWQSRSASANLNCTGYPRCMPTSVRIYSDYV